MADPQEDYTPGPGLRRTIDHIKGHPVIYAIGAAIAGLIFVFNATDALTRAKDVVTGLRNPHAAEYAALETLDLDTRLEFFEDNFGTAKSVFDLCQDGTCPQPAPESLRMYIHETDDLAIRAVFDGDRLELYLVTLMSPELSPVMEWQGYDLGRLGNVTLAEALAAANSIEPTDSAIFMGPQSTAYADVVSVGAPGRYRGLLLAWAPDGYGGPEMAFDLDSGRMLVEAEINGVAPDPAALATFRSATTPNTYGEFRDDGGYVGSLVQEANDLIPLLFVGTEL